MLAITKHVAAALQKGCDAWQLQLDKLSFDGDGDATAKTAALKAVQNCYDQRSKHYLAQACSSRQRLLDSLKRQHGGLCGQVDLILESKLLVHLARANVLENVGLYADRTTGLPLIPGTALKGILSTWACWESNQKIDGSFNDGSEFLRERRELGGFAGRVFGDDSKEGSERAGDVIFVGGFPVSPPNIGLDIVNPHHEPNGTEKQILTPNAFLCVEPGMKWRFVFYVKHGAIDSSKLVQTVSTWLTEALTQLGLGAKTSAGYGRFREMTSDDLSVQVKEAERSKAAASAAFEKERGAAEKAKHQAAALVAMSSDYPNEATYRNSVLRLADNPGQWSLLQRELEKLKKPENAAWLARFKRETSDRAYRKLRDQPWYPK